MDLSSLWVVARIHLRLLVVGHLRALPLLLRAQLRRELRSEILRLEYLADLDFGVTFERVGAALDPVDRLFLRFHLPDPEAGNQLLGLGEGTVDHRALRSREADARALRARLQPFA